LIVRCLPILPVNPLLPSNPAFQLGAADPEAPQQAPNSSRELAIKARDASRTLQGLSSEARGNLLHQIADAIESSQEVILQENEKDCQVGTCIWEPSMVDWSSDCSPQSHASAIHTAERQACLLCIVAPSCCSTAMSTTVIHVLYGMYDVKVYFSSM